MKKVISLTLCLLLFFSFSAVNVNAATTATQAGSYLKQIGVYQGDTNGDGSLRLGDYLTRTEFAVLVVRLLGQVDKEPTYRGKTDFNDVSSSFWGSGYINLAVAENLMQGDPATKLFRPQGQITYAEAVTVLIRILGYEKGLDVTNWPETYMKKADELKITKNIGISQNDPITRGDIAILIYDSLDIPVNK